MIEHKSVNFGSFLVLTCPCAMSYLMINNLDTMFSFVDKCILMIHVCSLKRMSYAICIGAETRPDSHLNEIETVELFTWPPYKFEVLHQQCIR